MIIEVPLLSLISLWAWNTAYLRGKKPKEFVSASATYSIICHCINLIWLFLWYPHFELEIDDKFYAFAALFMTVTSVVFRKCKAMLVVYLLVAITTYVIARTFIPYTGNIEYLLSIAGMEIGVPSFWIVVFREYAKHKGPIE